MTEHDFVLRDAMPAILPKRKQRATPFKTSALESARRVIELERSAAKNRALVLERFTRERAAAQLLEVLTSVVKGDARTRI